MCVFIYSTYIYNKIKIKIKNIVLPGKNQEEKLSVTHTSTFTSPFYIPSLLSINIDINHKFRKILSVRSLLLTIRVYVIALL
jgi:hypothetical protein